jgi:hypothetical protein
MYGLENAMVTLIAALAVLATLVFWNIQVYLHDPRRRELNDAWFTQFEEHIRKRYQDPELEQRVHVMERQFEDYC